MKTNDLYLDNSSNTVYKIIKVKPLSTTISRLDNTEKKELSIDAMRNWWYVGNTEENFNGKNT